MTGASRRWKYSLLLVGVSSARLFVLLPRRAQLFIGALLGRASWRLVDGRIVECGTHAELQGSGGLYRGMVERQGAGDSPSI